MTRHALRFVLVGGIATLVHYAILIWLTEMTSVGSVLASAVGFTVSVAFNYLGNYYFTFGSSERHWHAGPKFAVVATVGLMLNTGMMYVFIAHLATPYMLAQLVATALVTLWNFFANRHWTYRASSTAH